MYFVSPVKFGCFHQKPFQPCVCVRSVVGGKSVFVYDQLTQTDLFLTHGAMGQDKWPLGALLGVGEG